MDTFLLSPMADDRGGGKGIGNIHPSVGLCLSIQPRILLLGTLMHSSKALFEIAH